MDATRRRTGAPLKIYDPKDIPPLTRGADGEDHYMINGALSPSYIVLTAEYFVLRLNDDGTFERCQIIMQKTQYKKSRYWNTMMMNQKVKSAGGQMITLPMFANVYKMATVQEQNKKNDWWGFGGREFFSIFKKLKIKKIKKKKVKKKKIKKVKKKKIL